MYWVHRRHPSGVVYIMMNCVHSIKALEHWQISEIRVGGGVCGWWGDRCFRVVVEGFVGYLRHQLHGTQLEIRTFPSNLVLLWSKNSTIVESCINRSEKRSFQRWSPLTTSNFPPTRDGNTLSISTRRREPYLGEKSRSPSGYKISSLQQWTAKLSLETHLFFSPFVRSHFSHAPVI